MVKLDGQFERTRIKILSSLVRHDGVRTRAQLWSCVRYLEADDRRDIFTDIVEAGQIHTATLYTGRRSLTVFEITDAGETFLNDYLKRVRTIAGNT